MENLITLAYLPKSKVIVQVRENPGYYSFHKNYQDFTKGRQPFMSIMIQSESATEDFYPNLWSYNYLCKDRLDEALIKEVIGLEINSDKFPDNFNGTQAINYLKELFTTNHDFESLIEETKDLSNYCACHFDTVIYDQSEQNAIFVSYLDNGYYFFEILLFDGYTKHKEWLYRSYTEKNEYHYFNTFDKISDFDFRDNNREKYLKRYVKTFKSI